MNDVPLDQIPLAQWLELVDSKFVVRTDSPHVTELNLVRVESAGKISPRSASSDVPRIESFSLVFQGPSNRALLQGTYRFEHSSLGQFDLFIVPVARGANAWEYEAVFNRLVKPD
jgi:hypothetical protein